MIVEALVAIVSGIAAGSLLLLTFGADSVIELVSGIVLHRRLTAQAKGAPADDETWEAKERKAARIAGALLYALAAYVVLQGVYGLFSRHQAETTGWGLAVTLIAAVGMPLLAKAKMRLAARIGSRALRADAMESLTCAYLAWVVLAGLVADALLGWWWLDAAVSLAIVPLLVREAREAFSGEHDGDDRDDRGEGEERPTETFPP